MNCAHFYHCWCDGAWRDPVTEHIQALADASFTGYFAVGLVGSNRNRHEALAQIREWREPNRIIAASTGFEQVTLTQAHRYAAKHDGAILYAHTKGAHDNTEFRALWRRSMTVNVVSRWRENLAALQDGADLVGCHWLTQERYPGIVADTPFPMLGGNYWIARCDYLRCLPSPTGGDRYAAEAWVGLGDPCVVDLTPGWPGLDTFTMEAACGV